MPVIYPRGVYIVHQLQKISRSLAIIFLRTSKMRERKKDGLVEPKKEEKKKKEREKSTAYEKPIHVCSFEKKKNVFTMNVKKEKKLMIFIVDPTTVRIERRDGNGIVIDYTVHSGRRCDKFVLMTRQLSFPPVFAYSSDAICAV